MERITPTGWAEAAPRGEPTRLSVISLWQPWASLIFVAEPYRKLHETRHWPAPERLIGQRIGIHAAQKFPALDPALRNLATRALGPDFRTRIPGGCLIGTVRLVSCDLAPFVRVGTTAADRLAGDFGYHPPTGRPRYAWKLADPELLAQPIPMRGQQSFWTIDPTEISV